MIPRDRPKDVRDAEWVAMHMGFQFPEVTDAGFLEAFKKVMIEVAGDRLYDYRAAEQVEACLVAGGYSCPIMEKEAAAEGFSRYSKIKDFIRLQMDVLRGAAAKWQGDDPMHLEMWPAWMLTWTGIGGESDWRERWVKAGGKIFQPLIEGRNPDHEESGLIALKTDTIWRRLGDPLIFPGALGIDHPPFYAGSWLSWKPVEKIEAIAHGLMPSVRPIDGTVRMIAKHIENEQAFAEILDASVKKSREAYARREADQKAADIASYPKQEDW